MKIFFDGGCRPDGMETAVVIGGRTWVERDLGPGDAMQAEWRALLRAAEMARACEAADIVLLGDAAAVIAQANRAVRCRPAYAHHLEALDALRVDRPLRIRHIKRSQNLAGIALARSHAR